MSILYTFRELDKVVSSRREFFVKTSFHFLLASARHFRTLISVARPPSPQPGSNLWWHFVHTTEKKNLRERIQVVLAKLKTPTPTPRLRNANERTTFQHIRKKKCSKLYDRSISASNICPNIWIFFRSLITLNMKSHFVRICRKSHRKTLLVFELRGGSTHTQMHAITLLSRLPKRRAPRTFYAFSNDM